MEQIAVSVIVPVYNTSQVIMQCLGNLVHQSLQSIEILLIDDCSTDNSMAILKECQQQFPDIVRVYQTDHNRGPGGARNVGLDAAQGEYIGFVDSDDVPAVEMYEKLYRVAKENDYDMVDGGCIFESENRAVVMTADEETGILNNHNRAELIARGGYLVTRICKRSVIEQAHLRFRENISLEDSDYLTYLLGTIHSIGNLKEIIYQYRDMPGSLSKDRDKEVYYRNLIHAMRANYECMAQLPNYTDIQCAVEYEITQMYSYAVTLCAGAWLKKEDYPVVERLTELQQLKKKIVAIDYDKNPYVTAKIAPLDIEIMRNNDISVQGLLAQLTTA